MGSGTYIVWGVLMLLIVPVIMAGIGNTFGETLESSSNNTATGGGILLTIGNFFSNFGIISFFGFEIDMFGGAFDWLGDMFKGYSLLPIWLNAIIFFIPVLLIVRGVLSTS